MRTTSALTCTVTGVVAGTAYGLSVRATNAAAPPSILTFSSVTAAGSVTMVGPPEAPADPTAEVSDTTVTVSWPAIPADQLTPSATVTVTADRVVPRAPCQRSKPVAPSRGCPGSPDTRLP